MRISSRIRSGVRRLGLPIGPSLHRCGSQKCGGGGEPTHEHEQDAGDDQDRKPDGHHGGKRGRDGGEEEDHEQRREQDGQQPEPGAETQPRRFPLELDGLQFELELRQPRRVLGDRAPDVDRA